MTGDNEQYGIIFNIQRYSIHDGPGIRTTVFFKGCPLRCFWCQNPESQIMKSEIFLNHESCTLCGRCVEVCTTGASYLLDESSEIDRNKCIICGECVQVCFNEARKLVGLTSTVDDVLQEVLRDEKFYKNSGGGVTLSGGEPLFQPQFALALLEKCKYAGLHTTLETAGYAQWPAFEEILRFVDLVLYDIKHIDDARHIEGTGVSNHLILENARLVSQLKPMMVRAPLVPGFNDSEEDLAAIAHFVKSELGLASLELLAYNKLGESKYNLLDRTANARDLQNEERVQALQEMVNKILQG